MQFVVALHVEDLDVRVLSGDPPQMHPVPGALQFLGAAFSSAFSRSNSAGSMPCGGRTSILTWYSMVSSYSRA